MKIVYKILGATVLLYPFAIGYYLGSYAATERIQHQAVAAGAAEFITTSTNGHKLFEWVKPNCGPH